MLDQHLKDGKTTEEEIKYLSDLSVSFPYDFGTFTHMLNNVIGLIQKLTNTSPESSGLLFHFYQDLLNHERTNERIYRDQHKNCWYLYIMILGYITKMGIRFLESCAHGKVSKLAIPQLKTYDLKDSIDSPELNYRKPSFLINYE